MKHFYTFRNQNLHNNASMIIRGQQVALSEVNSFSEDESSDYDREYSVTQSITINGVAVTGIWLDPTVGPKKKSE